LTKNTLGKPINIHTIHNIEFSGMSRKEAVKKFIADYPDKIPAAILDSLTTTKIVTCSKCGMSFDYLAESDGNYLFSYDVDNTTILTMQRGRTCPECDRLKDLRVD
jgi:hypothetical protein